MISIKDGKLYQWDTGRIVMCKAPEGMQIDEIHLDNYTTKNAIILKTYLEGDYVCAKIPDVVLQKLNPINIYTVMRVENDEKTIESSQFNVIQRKKPEDYVYEEEEILRYDTLEEKIKELEEKIENFEPGGGGGGNVEITAESIKEALGYVPADKEKIETPDYSAAEGEKGHILNRPFYEDVTIGELLPATTVGDEGSENFIPNTLSLKIGRTYTVNWNGTEYAAVCKEYDGYPALGNIERLNDEGDTGEPFVILPIPPELAAKLGVSGTVINILDDSTEVVVSIIGEKEELKKLDNKFLSLDWLPVYYGEVEVFPETILKNGSGSIREIDFTTFNEGEKAIVYCDGVRYECVCFSNSGYILIGNKSFIGGMDTGEPFLIVTMHSKSDVSFNDIEEHTVSVKKLNYNNIPKWYLPKDIFGHLKELKFIDEFSDATVSVYANQKGLYVCGSDGTVLTFLPNSSSFYGNYEGKVLKVVDGMPAWSEIPEGAEVTKESIKEALGYVPADEEDINKLSEEIDNLKTELAIPAFEIVDDKLFELAPKKEFDQVNSCYTKTEIPENVSLIKVSGKSASATYGYGLGAFYDAEWNHIESIPSEDNTEYTNLEVSVPQNAKYIVVNFKEIKNNVTDILAFTMYPVIEKITETETKVEDIAQELDEIVSNLNKKTKVDLNFSIAGYLEARPTDVSFIRWGDSEISRSTDYEDCTGYEKIKVNLNGNEYMWQVAFYDENKVFLPNVSIPGSRDIHEYAVQIPSTAKYVRVCTYNINQINPKAEMIPENSIDEKILELENKVNEMENNKSILDGYEFSVFKKWGVIGDSLSVGHTVNADGTQTVGRNIYYSWGQYLARKIGNTCLNFGASGLSAKTWMSSEYGYNRLIRSENLCQCYVVGLGANDTNMTLGSISDINFNDMSQNADTEYGWYAKVINAIRSVSSEAPIFLLTLAYPRNNDVNVQAINEMIRTLASDEHFDKVFVVDLDSDYNDYFASGKLFDQIGNTGWHLTSLGYLYTSRVIEMGLSKVIADNYGEFQDVFLLPCGNAESLD